MSFFKNKKHKDSKTANPQPGIQTTQAENLRNTSLKYSKLPEYSKGCPSCGDKPLVTLQKLLSSPPILGGDKGVVRFCRCRACDWKGKVKS